MSTSSGQPGQVAIGMLRQVKAFTPDEDTQDKERPSRTKVGVRQQRKWRITSVGEGRSRHRGTRVYAATKKVLLFQNPIHNW